jgi:[acyl-carrier-protein] S-malonyltransferase
VSRPLVLLFGGQSSRDPAMFDRLQAADPAAGGRARERAARHVDGDPTDFSSNRTIQVSVLAVTLGWLEVVESRGLRSAASAGLSLGEYAHLVDVGALAPDDALALVARRGELYDRGPEGVMAAVFPASWEELGPLVARVAEAHGGPAALSPAVFNSPSQTVVGGSREAVTELMDLADEELFARGVVVEESIPMHTPRFRAVAAPFREALTAAPWTGRARIPYRPNVTAAVSPADPGTVVEHLTRHVHEPVLWRDTVDALAGELPDAVFLETSPRTVLKDLMLRRWHAGREVHAVDAPDAPVQEMWQRVRATLDSVARALTAEKAAADPRPAPEEPPPLGTARPALATEALP